MYKEIVCMAKSKYLKYYIAIKDTSVFVVQLIKEINWNEVKRYAKFVWSNFNKVK